MYSGEDSCSFGKLDISVFKNEENKFTYFLNKSGQENNTICNFILGEILRYVRISTQEIRFLKKKNFFFSKVNVRGYRKSF